MCSSNTTLSLNLVCYNEARLLIVTAKSGSQARDICLFPQDFEVPLNGSCHEEINTSIFVKERCDNKKSCLFKLKEAIPNKCPKNTSNYIKMKYKCVTNYLPYRPFMKKRYGLDIFKSHEQFTEEKNSRENAD